MTVRHLGSLTVGEVVPGAVNAVAAGVAGINAALPDLQGQLASLLSFSPTPIDLTAQITALQSMITGIQTQIALGVPAPSLATQLANIQALISSLQSLIAAIQANLATLTNFQALLSGPGVHAYAFEGQVSLLGPEMGAELGGGAPGGLPNDEANALVLLTTIPATWALLAQILRVSP